ncbi:Pathogenesis-related protein 1C, partial [Bienertia sinuspersici]
MAPIPAKTVIFSLLLIFIASTISHASNYRTYEQPPQEYKPSYTQTQPSYTNYQGGPHYTNPYYTYEDKPYYTQDKPDYIQPPPSPTFQPPPSPTFQESPPEKTPEKSYSGGGASGSEKEAFLQVHNAARAYLGLPPFTWDDKVASFAQWWANQRINDCRLVHSDTEYGENIFWGSGGYSAAFAVQSWVNERKYYDYRTNACTGGMDCGHYTQIIWKKSTRLGCARVVCNNGGVYITCNYDPPGNYIGTRPPPHNPNPNGPPNNPSPTNPPHNPTPTSPPHNNDWQSEQRKHSTKASREKASFLQVHNSARADVGLAPMTWDDEVAAYAQSWANKRINDCRLVHSDTNYGENIFWGSGGYSAAFAVQSWVNERKYYDYNSNSCKRGMDCGHYTQIVWKKSTRIGCARVRCNNGGVFITCNYDPPGNYIGSR